MILVYLESPFAPPPLTRPDDAEWHIAKHLAYARAAMADCLRRGEAPFVSHALYTQAGVLDDTIPAERSLGMKAGFHWARVAAKSVFYLDYGWSRGMREGLLRAIAQKRPIEKRRLYT